MRKKNNTTKINVSGVKTIAMVLVNTEKVIIATRLQAINIIHLSISCFTDLSLPFLFILPPIHKSKYTIENH